MYNVYIIRINYTIKSFQDKIIFIKNKYKNPNQLYIASEFSRFSAILIHYICFFYTTPYPYIFDRITSQNNYFFISFNNIRYTCIPLSSRKNNLAFVNACVFYVELKVETEQIKFNDFIKSGLCLCINGLFFLSSIKYINFEFENQSNFQDIAFLLQKSISN